MELTLPLDYADCILSTVWGEHNLTLTRLRPRGISVEGQNRIIVEGVDEGYRAAAFVSG